MVSTSSTSPASRCSPGCKEALFTRIFWPAPTRLTVTSSLSCTCSRGLLAFRSLSYHSRLPLCKGNHQGSVVGGKEEGQGRARGLDYSTSGAGGRGRGWAVRPAQTARRTFRAAAMSMFSSVSKGQISKEGWKSCSLSRHLGEEPQLTAGCPTRSPTPPHPSGCTHFSSSSRRCMAVLLVAGK